LNDIPPAGSTSDVPSRPLDTRRTDRDHAGGLPDQTALVAQLLGLQDLQARAVDAGMRELEAMGNQLEDGAAEILDRLQNISIRFGFSDLLSGADPYDDTAVDASAITREALRADRARQAIMHVARILRTCTQLQAELAAAVRNVHPDAVASVEPALRRLLDANRAAGMSDLRDRMAEALATVPSP